MSEPERIGTNADSAPPRPRTCCRCESLAAYARKTGAHVPPVREVESWLVHGEAEGSLGLRYYGGLCADCADWEWSRRWNARRDQAHGDGNVIAALDRERQRMLAMGRRFYPSTGAGAGRAA